MDPVVALAQEKFSVEPGAQARLTVSVRNLGTVVEEYHFEVLGEASGWLSIEPETVSLFPGANMDVTLVANPPRVPAPPAGPTAFAVRCRSAVDPDDSAVVEGEVVVGGYLELAITLSPTIAKRRRTGTFRATVTNRGNLPDRVRLNGVDPTDELRFTVHPTVVEVPGSGRAEATVKVKAPAMFLKGAARRQPFDVVVGKLLPPKVGEPEGPKASAVLDQRPILSGAMTFLLVLAALAVAALVVVAKLNRDSSVASRAGVKERAVAALSEIQPAGVSSVNVVWKAVPDARSYVVEQVATGGTGGAPTVQQSIPAEGGAVSLAVTGLQPETQYCFRLTVTTPIGTSLPSDVMCAKTPAESSFGPPTGLLVTPVADTGSVQLTWTPSAPDAQHILLVDGKPQSPIKGAAAQLQVQPGNHCFAVIGVATDGAQTEQSNQSCVVVSGPATTTTTVAPGTVTTVGPPTSPPPSTTTTTIRVAHGWFALVESFPTGDFAQTAPLERAQRRRAEFESAGFSLDIATSDALGLKGVASWVLYADGFESAAKANEVCAAVRASKQITVTQTCVPHDSNAKS
jgi:hypothetical protein